MNTSEVLNKAADLIEERGWGQGPRSFYGTSSVCLEGAIGVAAFGEGANYGYPDTQGCPAGIAVIDYLGIARPASKWTYPWQWNDNDGRTANEVVEILRAAAVIEAAKETAPVEVSA